MLLYGICIEPTEAVEELAVDPVEAVVDAVEAVVDPAAVSVDPVEEVVDPAEVVVEPTLTIRKLNPLILCEFPIKYNVQTYMYRDIYECIPVL